MTTGGGCRVAEEVDLAEAIDVALLHQPPPRLVLLPPLGFQQQSRCQLLRTISMQLWRCWRLGGEWHQGEARGQGRVEKLLLACLVRYVSHGHKPVSVAQKERERR